MGLRVGLTGGLASGKTFVSEELERLGCLVVRADLLGHAVLARNGEAYDGVVAEFGESILDPAGAIDRHVLAGKVFGSPEQLAKLNALVHPLVRQRVARSLDDFFQTHPSGIGVVEAAILIETGAYKNYDKLIVVYCTPEQQVERAMKRDGATREDAMRRLANQMPLAEKLRFADYVVDTSGDKSQALEQTKSVFEALRNTTPQ
jgi:dephospho-CoA kinase